MYYVIFPGLITVQACIQRMIGGPNIPYSFQVQNDLTKTLRPTKKIGGILRLPGRSSQGLSGQFSATMGCSDPSFLPVVR